MSSLGWKLVRNFEQNFTVEGQEVTVKFVTMSCVQKQLYQVYVPYNGKTARFHIQKNEAGEFRIVGSGVCPPPYLPLEADFAAAIEASPVG